MIHGDAFSGIGGFALAAHEVGMETKWACEIDESARRTYTARIGNGFRFDRDIREVTNLPPIDVFTAGFPCQDISVAGARAGLAGRRSGLFFELVRILEIARPAFFCFENVDALLSSPSGNRGRDFGIVLSTLVECGYGIAWRVLDSQFFGLAQRRRRIFIVGHHSDWRVAASVLFEPASGAGHSATGRKARRGDQSGDQASTLVASGGRRIRAEDVRATGQIVSALVARGAKGVGSSIDGQLIAHTLTSEGADASEDGAGRGSPIITHPTLTQNSGKFGSGGRNGRPSFLVPTLTASGGHRLDRGRTGPEGIVAATLCAGNPHRGGSNAKTQAEQLIVSQNQRGEVREGEICGVLSVGGGIPGQGYQLLRDRRLLRRLTPYEWSILNGFPPHWSCVTKNYIQADLYATFRDCPICANGPDAHRYRGIGNAVSVPVVKWILGRIAAVGA